MICVRSTPSRSPVHWSPVTEDFEVTPSVLAPASSDRGRTLGRFLVGPLALLSLAIVLVFYILYVPNVVDGDSMFPALHDQDRVLVTRGIEDPVRGQVVIFDLLNTRTGQTERLIKRIVALPGDTVAVEAGVATINGAMESTASLITDPRDMGIRGSYVVPEDTVFVMGDNRPASLDSRQIGPVRLSAIEGEVKWIWAPINRIRPIR